MNEYRYYNFRDEEVAILFTDYETALEMKPILEERLKEIITNISVVTLESVAQYAMLSGERIEPK